jgi:hypothetical protein
MWHPRPADANRLPGAGSLAYPYTRSPRLLLRPWAARRVGGLNARPLRQRLGVVGRFPDVFHQAR